MVKDVQKAVFRFPIVVMLTKCVTWSDHLSSTFLHDVEHQIFGLIQFQLTPNEPRNMTSSIVPKHYQLKWFAVTPPFAQLKLLNYNWDHSLIAFQYWLTTFFTFIKIIVLGEAEYMSTFACLCFVILILFAFLHLIISRTKVFLNYEPMNYQSLIR